MDEPDFIRRIIEQAGAAPGTVVYGEVVFPIRRISLIGGQIVFYGEAPESVDLPGEAEVRIHGQDGELVGVTNMTLTNGACRIEASGMLEAIFNVADDSWPGRGIAS